MLAEHNGCNLRGKALARRFPCFCLAVFSVLLLASNPAFANTIVLTSILTNPSFEGPAVDGCASGWICEGSPGNGFGVYTPTSSHYTPGADGLPDGETVPDGNQVAYGPDGLAGSGTIQQTTDTPWIAGDTYSYTFWLGTPDTETDGTTPVSEAPAGAIRLYFTADGVQAGLPAYDLTPPEPGQWEELTLTVTPDQLWESGATGLDVGVMFFLSTDSTYETANIDADPPDPAPEPGTFCLGLTAFGAVFRMRRPRRTRANPL